MAQIRNPKVIYNDSAAGTGDWIQTTNGKYDDGKPYGISWTIVSGDTVRIEVTNDVEGRGGLEAPIASPAFTASEDFADTTTGTRVEGSWRFIRVVKVGANGTLRVVGGV